MPLNFNPETPVEQQRGLMFRRLFILFATMVCGMLLTSVTMLIVGGDTAPKVRILTMLQDILMFILPAVVTAMLCSHLPAGFLGIDRGFPVKALLVAVLLMAVSVPFQNFVIQWNASLTLPESMASVEQWMRAAEERGQESINLLMGGTSVADLIIGILIVGVFAALSEELFFRGALQRILRGSRSNAHAAIWIAAVVFSAFHFQFYGFVPRLLLGALFGYMLWWSGSLWLPIVVHALNNISVVSTEWHARVSGTANMADTLGADTPWLVLTSLALTIGALWLLRRVCVRKS